MKGIPKGYVFYQKDNGFRLWGEASSYKNLSSPPEIGKVSQNKLSEKGIDKCFQKL